MINTPLTIRKIINVSMLSFTKYYFVRLLYVFIFCFFSIPAEARFGGRESHESSVQQDSLPYCRYQKDLMYKNRCQENLHRIEGKDVITFLSLLGVVIGLPFLYIRLGSSRKPPKDINKLEFSRFLRERFLLLQVLWDQNNWDEISYYVDQSLMYSLQDTRTRTFQRDADTTKIRNLSTYIKGFKTTRDQCEVLVEFSGLDNDIYFKEEWTFKRIGGAGLPWILTQLVVKK